MQSASGRPPLRGWLLVLCLVLLVWGPLQLALVAASALAALPVRGTATGLVLVLRVATTAFGIAAGITLAARQSAALPMTQASLVLSAAVDLFVYATPYFPSNRMPGDTPYYAAASLLYYGAWLAYLSRSSRVKETLA